MFMPTMEMYCPSSKTKVQATIVRGEYVTSKGGSKRRVLYGEYNGKKCLPKTVKAEVFAKYGFSAEESLVGTPSPSSPMDVTPALVPAPAEPSNESFNAELETLGDDSAMITNNVGDMVGVVELEDDDDDMESVQVTISNDDEQVEYEGVLDAESFAADGSVVESIRKRKRAKRPPANMTTKEAKKWYSDKKYISDYSYHCCKNPNPFQNTELGADKPYIFCQNCGLVLENHNFDDLEFSAENSCTKTWDCMTCEKCLEHCACGNEKKIRRSHIRKKYGRTEPTKEDTMCGHGAESFSAEGEDDDDCDVCGIIKPLNAEGYCSECSHKSEYFNALSEDSYIVTKSSESFSADGEEIKCCNSCSNIGNQPIAVYCEECGGDICVTCEPETLCPRCIHHVCYNCSGNPHKNCDALVNMFGDARTDGEIEQGLEGRAESWEEHLDNYEDGLCPKCNNTWNIDAHWDDDWGYCPNCAVKLIDIETVKEAESNGLSKPAQTAIGLTALGVGLALWKSEWINKLFERK
jgi:hypothetical protein